MKYQNLMKPLPATALKFSAFQNEIQFDPFGYYARQILRLPAS